LFEGRALSSKRNEMKYPRLASPNGGGGGGDDDGREEQKNKNKYYP